MLDFTEESEQFATTLREEVIRNLLRSGRKVTGKTLESITQDITLTGFIIYAAEYIMVLDTGRSPTRSDKAGTPTLREILLQWIKDRGIIPNEGTKDENYKGLAYVMARKIHNEGSLIYRTGPTGDILNVLTENRIDAFIGTFSTKFMAYVRSEILEQFNLNK